MTLRSELPECATPCHISGKGKAAVLKIGMRVCGRWNEQGDDHGLWFDGEILSVCKSKRTVHIRFDDGDEDDSLSWDNVSILEQG